MPRDMYAELYGKMKTVVLDKPAVGNTPVYNIGSLVDGCYIVRQGKLSELHPIPCVEDERKLAFCRYYR